MISTNIFFKLYQSPASVYLDDTMPQYGYLTEILKSYGVEVHSMHTPLNVANDQYKMVHLNFCHSINFKDAYLMVSWLKQFGLSTVSSSRGSSQQAYYKTFMIQTIHVADIKYYISVDEFLKLDPYTSTIEDIQELKKLYRNQLVNA
jgi:hypothetical protein